MFLLLNTRSLFPVYFGLFSSWSMRMYAHPLNVLTCMCYFICDNFQCCIYQSIPTLLLIKCDRDHWTTALFIMSNRPKSLKMSSNIFGLLILFYFIIKSFVNCSSEDPNNWPFDLSNKRVVSIVMPGVNTKSCSERRNCRNFCKRKKNAMGYRLGHITDSSFCGVPQ